MLGKKIFGPYFWTIFFEPYFLDHIFWSMSLEAYKITIIVGFDQKTSQCHRSEATNWSPQVYVRGGYNSLFGRT
jgi:hypothetical protein